MLKESTVGLDRLAVLLGGIDLGSVLAGFVCVELLNDSNLALVLPCILIKLGAYDGYFTSLLRVGRFGIVDSLLKGSLFTLELRVSERRIIANVCRGGGATYMFYASL